jgi:hypothetical protein
MEGALIVGHEAVASRDLAQAGDVVGKVRSLVAASLHPAR